MFLKSLEIRGFKSFADKTELKFKKGVTAVVGPNGSGKSNISDSVRWVLGEQSVKTLRGGKMEDVIFAGTQFRKPVGLAQVSLTLDNQDGALSTEYNEVTVSRRIFRSGEAEYLINGTKCRLKDVTQLFMDTGIGKEGYSLIGQGKIEAILSGKPEERRALLEEAAGIVKYKSRKEEAEKKLSNTDENLVRIRDIISTYEERIEPLRIEREKALKYKEISDELREKEVSILVHNIRQIEEVLNDYTEEVLNGEESLKKKKNELAEEKEKLRALEEAIENLEKKASREKSEYYERKDEISQISNDIEIYKERIKNLKGIIEKNCVAIEDIKNKIIKLEEDKGNANIELSLKQEEQKAKMEEIKENEENNKGSIDKISEIESEIKKLKDSEFELLRAHSEISNSITLINNDLKIKQEKIELAKTSLISTEGNIKINVATLESLKENLEKNRNDVKDIEELIIEKKKEIASLSGKITRKDGEIRALNKTINEIEANKNILTNLEKHYEGYNRSVKTLMEKISEGFMPEANGTKVVGEVFKVEKEYETAVEIALGAGISNVITDNDKIAKELINYLKKNNLGRATFLPLNNIKGNKLQLDNSIKSMNGFIGIAAEIIEFKEKYEKAINNLLGRTIVCTDMDAALAISKRGNNSYRIVTLHGEIIAPGGALTGGSINTRNANILGRKREIEILGQNLETKKLELTKELNEIEALKTSLKNLDEEILNSRDEVHFKNVEIAKVESEVKVLKNEIDKLTHSIQLSNGEVNRNEEEIKRLNISLDEKEKELTYLDEQKNSNKDKILELDMTLINSRDKINEAREVLTDLKVNKASLDEMILSKKNEVLRIDFEINENNLKISTMDEENKENKENVNELDGKILAKTEDINLIEKRIVELEGLFKEDELQKEKFKEDFRKKDSLINESLVIINKEEGELNKKEFQKEKSGMEKDNLYIKLNEELNLTLAEAQEIAIDVPDVNKFKEDIGNLKRKVTALGIVNLAAIEEYEEIKEKYEFMSSQEKDLELAKGELLEVIDEMTSKMKIMFKDNFKILNRNFDETFKELFKGGSAELILSEGDELTANIDINVEPPGKKLQNINLMSGGEKVLSAIALLFAILKMKPTPFCILDEIEAALDDANVYRYAEFLKEFSNLTQFIVITHRKGTMEACDVMYGVTMEEKGVSKVVSVDLSEN
ncbi:chromosome segregation protein SMC [Clostridium sp. SHJSY1]|uniref:chromosome segregation protein SMC n=1 Tax=Clostridium sp. SHJSY1 TaxID=2942483 RepID=UPI0028764367|nr:chromosome segregation protein SMC [Clostridium sp. SHJSY1]MDS0524917.1 chromosome segregation protein SMC [Clostridium sp. SHJSY1]